MPAPRTPRLTVDLVLRCGGGLVFVERRHEPHGWALPGGFVGVGETLEQAAVREAKEETALGVRLVRQLRAYSDPSRDPRGHTVSVVFLADAEGTPVGGDDAKTARVFSIDAVPELVFDHARIVEEYLGGLT